MVNDCKNDNNEPQNLIPKRLEKDNAYTKIIFSVISLCAIVALVLAVYALILNHYEHKKSENLSAQVTKIINNHSKAQNQEESKEKAMVTLENKLSNKIGQLEQQLQTLNQANNFLPNEDWSLFKATYLLETAQLNSYWSNDYKSSLALLEQADALLNPFTEPKLLDIRQILAKEINQLKATSVIDLSGLLSQLKIAHELIDKLSFVPEKPIDNDSGKTETNSTVPKSLENSFKSLGKLFIIRQNDEIIKPLLSPQLIALLKESLHLDLQQAQWAILTQNNKVFELSLTQALSTLKRAFNDKDSNTLALIKQLQRIKDTPITAEKPKIGMALPLLKQWIISKESGKKQP